MGDGRTDEGEMMGGLEGRRREGERIGEIRREGGKREKEREQ